MSWSVFRPRNRGKLSRYYSAKIKVPTWSRERVFALKLTQKDVAEEKAREMARDFERESVNLPSLSAPRRAAKTPLADQLTAFLVDVEGRGRSPATVRVYRVVLGRLAKCCRWQTLADINAESFGRWRVGDAVSPKYANNALGYVRTFCTWLVKRRLLVENPFAEVEPVKVRQDRGKRYAPTPDAFKRLLQVAPPHRSTVYLFVVYTGLRRVELNGLTWGDIDLEARTVRVSGTISKNGLTKTLPLRPELVQALHIYRPALAQPFEWVFRGRVPNPKTFRADCERAAIPHLDEYGRRFDFHAMRTTFCTYLAVSQVPLRVASELMRHSETKLTEKTYTDAVHLPLVAAVEALPSFSLAAIEAEDAGQKHTRKAGISPVISGQNGAFSVAPCRELAKSEPVVSVSDCRATASSVPPCGGGENGRAGEIRTHDLLHPMQARYQATLQPE